MFRFLKMIFNINLIKKRFLWGCPCRRGFRPPVSQPGQLTLVPRFGALMPLTCWANCVLTNGRNKHRGSFLLHCGYTWLELSGIFTETKVRPAHTESDGFYEARLDLSRTDVSSRPWLLCLPPQLWLWSTTPSLLRFLLSESLACLLPLLLPHPALGERRWELGSRCSLCPSSTLLLGPARFLAQSSHRGGDGGTGVWGPWFWTRLREERSF